MYQLLSLTRREREIRDDINDTPASYKVVKVSSIVEWTCYYAGTESILSAFDSAFDG
jgi:hypothetical protein